MLLSSVFASVCSSATGACSCFSGSLRFLVTVIFVRPAIGISSVSSSPSLGIAGFISSVIGFIGAPPACRK